MKLNPRPADPVRFIPAPNGKFLSLDDILDRLRRDDVMDEALGLMKVGHQHGDDPRVVLRHVMGEFILCCANEMPKTESVEKAYSAWLGRGKTDDGHSRQQRPPG